MRNYYALCIILIIISCYFSCDPNEEDIIKETFLAYQIALYEGNGTKAAEFLDQKTLNFYGKLGKMALESDSVKVSRLSFYNKLLVLYLRQTVPKSQLIRKATKPKKLYATSFRREFIDFEALSNLELKIIKIRKKPTGKEADVWMGARGTEEKFPMKFKFQNEGWKINYATILNSLNRSYRFQVNLGNELPEDELLIYLIEEVSGRPARSDIWLPVLER